MGLREGFRQIRYNFFVSHILVLLAAPLNRFFVYLSRQIQMKVKLNGGSVMYDDIRVFFPKNVGVGFVSNILWKGVQGFEPTTWRTLKRFSRDANVLFDIGSHFGFYSVLAQQINDVILTRCYEPIPALYLDNVKFHQCNNCSRQSIFNLAISDSSGVCIIHLPSDERQNEVRSASLEGDFFYNELRSMKKVTIEATTLDDLLVADPELNRKKIVVKIDIEGHEWAALQGGLNFIHSLTPIIVCEIDKSSERVQKLNDILHSVDYVILAIVKEGLFKLQPSDLLAYKGNRDFLLVHRNSSFNRSYISFEDLDRIEWNADTALAQI